MENFKQQLKNIFTSYWHFLAIQNACKSNIFDEIDAQKHTFLSLIKKLNLAEKPLFYLLSFLEEQNYIVIKNGIYFLEEKGQLLTENHPETLKNACLLWGNEHLVSWQNLDFTLKTAQSSFEYIYQKSFFEYLKDKPEKLKNYHLAMCEYAREDYKSIAKKIDFSAHKTIADIGGGLGVLLQNIAEKNPETYCILFDLPEVLSLYEHKAQRNFDVIEGSFFEKLPFKTDAIILSKVLHDWNDDNCGLILQNCKNALKKNGVIYLIENLQNDTKTHLLSLNMLLMCQSFERTYQEYATLLAKINFKITATEKLNDLQTILICKNDL
ncbi:MAG: methyltransferase domain-containing protein [Bacteroidetes bacterium]|nr:MAG: methyltransferase domain-containing protein [Bacteroidota bacterium]TAG87218.1 MAG: methyltransferase domain-containing protein [Bacteroidota bacterium]